MKKVCLFLLAAVLLVCVAYAALADAKPGEEVTVTLSLSNTNAAYVCVVASYDKSVFDLVGYSASSGTAGSNGIVMYDTGVLPSGAVGTVTLKVKDGAAPGTYTVGASLAECYDINENNGSASVSGGSVTVAGNATPAPTAAPTAVPTAEPTKAPTVAPTVAPTAEPTAVPTEEPIVEPTVIPTVKPTAVPKTQEWRSNQSVCSLGIRFRDIAPEITKKWYMFTPIDLSKDGVQTFDLIAANITYAGKVTVEVNGDTVTVNYKLAKPMKEKDMAVTILPDLASVSSVEIKDGPAYQFGKEISIANDLKGDTKVLLYVLGHVTYDFKDARNETFIPNDAKYQKLVVELKDLMD